MFELNLDEVEELSGGLDAGVHELTVSNAELCETKARNGLYYKIEFTANNGQKHWENFNVKNPNEKAEKIGRSQLKKFLAEAGYKEKAVSDVNKLMGLKVRAEIVIKDEGDFGKNPRVKKYLKSAAEDKGANPF